MQVLWGTNECRTCRSPFNIINSRSVKGLWREEIQRLSFHLCEPCLIQQLHIIKVIPSTRQFQKTLRFKHTEDSFILWACHLRKSVLRCFEDEKRGKLEIARAERLGEHWRPLAWFNVKVAELRLSYRFWANLVGLGKKLKLPLQPSGAGFTRPRSEREKGIPRTQGTPYNLFPWACIWDGAVWLDMSNSIFILFFN